MALNFDFCPKDIRIIAQNIILKPPMPEISPIGYIVLPPFVIIAAIFLHLVLLLDLLWQ